MIPWEATVVQTGQASLLGALQLPRNVGPVTTAFLKQNTVYLSSRNKVLEKKEFKVNYLYCMSDLSSLTVDNSHSPG